MRPEHRLPHPFQRFIAATAWMAVILIGRPASAEEPESRGSPDDPIVLGAQAVASNPDLGALNARVSALEHKARAVQRFADPVLGVEYSNVPWNTWALNDSPMSGVQFKLEQAFPLPGKNRRREAVVRQDQKAAKWQLEEGRVQLRGLVREAYWALTLTRQLQDITRKHIDLVDSLIGSVRAKYQVGRVGQHDLLRLQVLREQLVDDLEDFMEREHDLTATINAARHQDVATPIVTPDEVTPISPGQSLDTLQEKALKNRPLLRRFEALAAARREAAGLARYERWPDVRVWAGYRVRSPAATDPGTDFFSLGVGVPLPFDFLSRASAKAAEQRELARSYEQARLSAIDQIANGLATALAAWERAASKSHFYLSTLIPDAETTLKATLSAYEVDRADFASLYQAERELLEFDRAARVAVVQTHVQRVRVETLTGVEPGAIELKGE